MDYYEALDYIHGTLKFGSKLGLENIRVLLEYMGNPHRELEFIHVAGTNGKGSTTAMITQILIEQGYKTGMFISPFIEEFTERIQVDGKHIDRVSLTKITERIKYFIDEMVEKGHNHPTEFEIVTAIAFQYFSEMKCDYVVLEVGLGGRFDSTNVIDSSLVSVITSIGMDHMEYLGDTIEKITYEKCGIIKLDGYVSVYPLQDSKVMGVIEQRVLENSATAYYSSVSELKVLSDTIYGSRFVYKDYGIIKLNLLGEHQIYNAITAINTIEIMKKAHEINISNSSIIKGLEKVRWPGRLEIIGKEPLFIIDGAHNESGVEALVHSLNNYADGKKITIIIGMLRDKEYERCIKRLAHVAELVVATTPRNNRALTAKELAERVAKHLDKVVAEGDIDKALQIAIENTGKKDIICCCGSLYLLGDVRKAYIQK